MNRLFLFDFDSTLINQEVIELIASHAGVGPEVREITELAMSGELDFKQSLVRRVALLKGLPSTILEEVRDEITFTEGATELIEQLQAQGDEVAVISGGFTNVIAPLMKLLKIKHYRANQLEIVNGKLTGSVIGPIIDRESKALYLAQLKAELDPIKTFAIGDGANDIEMVKEADLGVAFCAKEALKVEADLVIEKRDLRELLKFL